MTALHNHAGPLARRHIAEHGLQPRDVVVVQAYIEASSISW
jgi:hypothetical protein